MTERIERTTPDEAGEERNSGQPAEEEQVEHKLAEQLLAEKLIGGEPELADAEDEALRRLPPKWEIRIQTKHDPVAEETKKYREMAQEVDDRYDERKEK